MNYFTAVIVLAAIAYKEVHGGVMVMPARLGETLVLNIPDDTREVQAALIHPENDIDRKPIVEDGKITQYAKQRYGDRITFVNGALKIKNMEENDATTYFYRSGSQPLAIDVVITN